MLFGLMKLITWLLSPLAIGLVGGLFGACLCGRGRKSLGACTVAAAALWLWVWSSPWFYIAIGGALESRYPSVPVDTLPRADAIVVLGGGMSSATPYTVYPELFPGADRGWQAARCFHAGRAPTILFSGVGEGPGMKQFLMDLGVPAAQIVLEPDSKNTFENGLFVREKLKEWKAQRVILVTSAWHMRRAVMTFKRLNVDVIPSGCDYEALTTKAFFSPRTLAYYLPSPDALTHSSAIGKEILGYWAYALYFRLRGGGG
jgi:uncharacterized SAM-binding protein YcdF (DUF218 family)